MRIAGNDWGIPSPLDYLPPAYGVLNLIYDTILIPQAGEQLEPWLATSHESSPDHLVHTFELRENVRWHDGRPLSVEDVLWTFDYFRSNNNLGLGLFRPENVERVRATGPRSVQIRLTKPAVTFARNVAGRLPIAPKHIWSSVPVPAAKKDLEALVGTGPYQLEEYEHGAYRFAANDSFFRGEPYFKRIEMLPIPDHLAALAAGEIDIGGFSVNPTGQRALAPFRASPEFGIREDRPDFVVALYWNLSKGGPLADVQFRRACAHAIDRQEMVRRLLGGKGTPGNPGFLPPGHPFHAEVDQYPLKLRTADALLDRAGYRKKDARGVRLARNGKPLRVKFMVTPDLGAAAEYVLSSLAKVGIRAEIDPVDQFAFLSGDYEMALLFYGGIREDPDYMRNVYSSRAQNKQFMSPRGYANPEFDDLADRQLITWDEAERRQLVTRMQQIVAADLPLLHLYYPTPVYVYRKSVVDPFLKNLEGGAISKAGLVQPR